LTTFVHTSVACGPSFSTVPLGHKHLLFRFTEAESLLHKKWGQTVD
jgi:hypothetical protein